MDKPVVPAAPTGKFEWDWQLIVLLTLLFVLIILGVRVIAWVRSWRQQNLSTLSPQDELSNYENLFKEGVINQAEFDQVRARLQKNPGQPVEEGFFDKTQLGRVRAQPEPPRTDDPPPAT